MFLTIIISLVCVCVTYVMACRHFLPPVNELVPTHPGKWPIIGHCHLLRNDLFQPLISFGEYCLKVGDVSKFFLGPMPVYGTFELSRSRSVHQKVKARCPFQNVDLYGEERPRNSKDTLLNQVVTDPEDVLTVLNKCLEKMFVYRFVEPMFGKTLVSAEVPTWKRNRRVADLCFKQYLLDDHLELFNDQAGGFVEQLIEEVGKGEVDLTEKITRSVLETACRTTLGARVDGKDLVNDNYVVAVNECLDIIATRINKRWLMFDFIFNLSSYKSNLSKALDTFFSLSEQMVQLRKSEHLQRLKNKGKFDYEGRKSQSVLDVLLENTVAETSSLFTDVDLRNITDNLLVAAFDTTVYEMLFIFVCIGSCPEVQDKIYQEINQVLGEDGRVSKEKLSQLVYLEAVIKESIRLYPIALVLGRQATTDTKLRNVTIPAGSSIVVHVWSTNRNPKYWGLDAEEFKPERWLSSDTFPDHPAAYASFSPGRRGCIGKTYALMYLKATIVRKFKLTADRTKLKLECKIMISPISGHFVQIEER